MKTSIQLKGIALAVVMTISMIGDTAYGATSKRGLQTNPTTMNSHSGSNWGQYLHCLKLQKSGNRIFCAKPVSPPAFHPPKYGFGPGLLPPNQYSSYSKFEITNPCGQKIGRMTQDGCMAGETPEIRIVKPPTQN